MSHAELQALVDSLASLDEDAAVTVITSVLQARPELAPPVVAFAVPDLTYPPGKALLERRSQGTVKPFDAQGLGGIQCEELHEVFGLDVLLAGPQVCGHQPGQYVSFAVVLNDENKPQAYDLQAVDASWASSGWDKGGMAAMAGKGSWGGGGDWSGGDGWSDGDMKGMMLSMMKGGCHDKGGKDMMQYMKGGKGMGKAKGGKDEGGKSAGKAPKEAQILGEYVGTIKSFNTNNGYGFIDAPMLKKDYPGDVFLHHQQLGEFKQGDTVQLTVYLNNAGKPQAKDLREPDGNAAKRARMA